MRFSDNALKKLEEIYREEFNQEITRDEAEEIGTRLVNLIKLLRRPVPKGRDSSSSSRV